MVIPELNAEQCRLALRAWAECIIREDGDRDEDTGSNLTVEQTIGAAKVMLAAVAALSK